MKHYPSISKKIIPELKFTFFEKLDGSNIRAEWTSDKGFVKFGSRKRLIGPDSLLAEAIKLIEAQREPLDKILKAKKVKKAILYFEFLGESSFAGQHTDEPHKCILIDVEVCSKGFFTPEDFIESFTDVEGIDIPRVLGTGELTEATVGKIKAGAGEGVVAKVGVGIYHNAMVKVKTDAWIAKVHSLYSDPKILMEIL